MKNSQSRRMTPYSRARSTGVLSVGPGRETRIRCMCAYEAGLHEVSNRRTVVPITI